MSELTRGMKIGSKAVGKVAAMMAAHEEYKDWETNQQHKEILLQLLSMLLTDNYAIEIKQYINEQST